MKLGTQTNSLTNHIYARSVIGQPEPVVGMGATTLGWTDRHACTVIEWDEKKNIVKVQRDNATRADKNGMSESQEYEYTPNPDGAIYTFKREASGKWSEMRVNERTGRLNKVAGGGSSLRMGERCEYYDYSF